MPGKCELLVLAHTTFFGGIFSFQFAGKQNVLENFVCFNRSYCDESTCAPACEVGSDVHSFLAAGSWTVDFLWSMICTINIPVIE
jgi:hypothetical protein